MLAAHCRRERSLLSPAIDAARRGLCGRIDELFGVLLIDGWGAGAVIITSLIVRSSQHSVGGLCCAAQRVTALPVRDLGAGGWQNETGAVLGSSEGAKEGESLVPVKRSCLKFNR